MDGEIRTALLLARSVLWELLVADARGDCPLGDQQPHVEQAHNYVDDLIRECGIDETDN